MSDEIITTIPKSFLDEFADHIVGTIPHEKVQAELRQASLARVMAAEGSIRMNGLGQVAARIDPRLYFRWLHENKCAPPHTWIDDLLADNPQLCSKGYKPKPNALRHGFTFVNGECVSKTKGRIQV